MAPDDDFFTAPLQKPKRRKPTVLGEARKGTGKGIWRNGWMYQEASDTPDEGLGGGNFRSSYFEKAQAKDGQKASRGGRPGLSPGFQPSGTNTGTVLKGHGRPAGLEALAAPA